MNKKKIPQLSELEPFILKLPEVLRNMGYSVSFVLRMQAIWKSLLHYATDHGSEPYNSEFRQKFTVDHFGHCLGDLHPAFLINRALTMLSDYIEYGVIIKNTYRQGKAFTSGYTELFEGYLDYLKNIRHFSENSIRTRRGQLFRFENFLLQSGICTFDALTLHDLNRYIETLAGYSSNTSSEIIRVLRYLFDYALENNYHKTSFASKLPHIKNTRQQRLPSIFTFEEIKRLLASIDRNNPIGKRNYAFLLLATRLGIRAGDIRALEFSSIDWVAKKLSIVQQKTGRFLELPLLDDIGWAIIDYLRNGRPETDCQKIFVEHRAPHEDLGPNIGIVQKQMRKAGIKTPSNKRGGMHALRHGLASSMLENGVPLPVISSTLGHADIRSTEVYLRISFSQLKMCPLEVNL